MVVFPDARRSPENQGSQGAGSKHRPERTIRAKQLVLANHLLQRTRAQPVGQRMPSGFGL